MSAKEVPQPEADAEADAAAEDAVATDDVERHVAALQADLDAARERLLRARADYDNLQKRVARDSALERERAKARVLEGLLPLHELCQMAAHQAQAHPDAAHGLAEGLTLLAREFSRFLEREGLVPVGQVGEAFDRAVHEAVAEEPADGVAPGHVTRVVQTGYRLGDKVLRYAKVAVAPKDPQA
jgi:molecular chaperone GrpE